MALPPAHSSPFVYTVGHSNHGPDKFLELLRRHEIDAIVDTRSQPYSKYTPHFNGEALRQLAQTNGIRYGFMGKALGGRPEEAEFYDAQGHVLYYKVAESARFLDGVERVVQGLNKLKVALLCSEENPFGCHRRLLVSRVLARRGIEIRHIRGDASIQVETDVPLGGSEDQPLLFVPREVDAWRSLRSVLAKRPQSSSLDGSGSMEFDDSSMCD